jgi:hypothetical protein
MRIACRLPGLCFAAVLLAFGVLAAVPLRAETNLRFEFTHLDSRLPAPTPTLTVTDLFSDTMLDVTAQDAAEATTVLSTIIADTRFDGPYARLRVVVGGLELPPGDSKSGQEIRFAFEIVLRRALVGDGQVVIRIPVVTSSRRQAMKPYLAMPDLVDDLPDRFFLAQQWMSLYQAGPDAVAAAPQAFALHRLISRAVADFAIATADERRGPVLVLPVPELAQTLDLYWSSMPTGKRTHLTAFADARTILWMDVPQVEDLLRKARRNSTEAPSLCRTAETYLGFFARRRPLPDEAAWVDAMFPVPGTLDGYLNGRQLDIGFTCTRLRL